MNKASPEFNQFAATPWTTITTGVDACAFHGKIVAYQTDTPYFGDPASQWQKSAPTTYFGYVDNYGRTWRQPENRGPRLSKIVKPDAAQGLCAITETMLNYEGSALLRMREATQAELDFIRQSVATGVAKIEHANSQAVQALGLKNHKPQQSASTL